MYEGVNAPAKHTVYDDEEYEDRPAGGIPRAYEELAYELDRLEKLAHVIAERFDRVLAPDVPREMKDAPAQGRSGSEVAEQIGTAADRVRDVCTRLGRIVGRVDL